MTDRPVALITGGAKRVGAEIARTLSRRGCDLHITYRSSDEEARALAGELETLGASVTLHRLDLSDLGGVELFGRTFAAEYDRLDVLIHNASIYRPSPLAELDAEALEQHARVNALAPALLTAQLAEALRAGTMPSRSAVVCMVDIHAMGCPRKGFAAYSMSKAALAELVRSLARDLAPGVRVNGIAPGVVAWPESGEESDEEAQEQYLKRVPLGRAGTPEDAATAVAFLALDAAYTTGQILRIDGGRFLA